MKKFKFLSILFLIFFLFASTLSAEVIDKIVAVVNNEIITLSDLIDFYKVQKEKGITQLSFEESKETLLSDLIERKLIDSQLKEANIEVIDKEVELAMDDVLKNNNVTREDLVKILAKENITLTEYKEKISDQIKRTKIIDREVQAKLKVSDEDLKDYYLKHSSEFVEDVSYHIAFIVVNKTGKDAQKKIYEAYQRIRSGDLFEDMVQQYSEDTSKKANGDVGFVKLKDLELALRKDIEWLKPGRITSPLEGEKAFYIVKLIELKIGKQKSLEESREQIKKILYDKEFEKREKVWLKNLKEKASIEIKM